MILRRLTIFIIHSIKTVISQDVNDTIMIRRRAIDIVTVKKIKRRTLL